MIWSTPRTDSQEAAPSNWQARAIKLVKQFVAFSNFYGEYISLPPWQRHQYRRKSDR